MSDAKEKEPLLEEDKKEEEKEPEKVVCDSCGHGHHRGSVIVYLENMYHKVRRGHCHDYDLETPVEVVPACLTAHEVRALIDNVMCMASKLQSDVEIDACSKKPVAPHVAVSVYVPSERAFGVGSFTSVVSDKAPIAMMQLSRSQAYTAAANSSSTVSITTRVYDKLIAGPWHMYDTGSKALGVAMTGVPGGIPLYRNGQVIGGLGVAGVDVELLHDLAVKAAGECFAIPASLVEKMDSLASS